MPDEKEILIQPQGEPVRSSKKWTVVLVSVFFLLVVAGGGAAAYAYYQIFSPADKNNFQISLFEVEKGMGVKEIGAKLYQEKFIRSQFWFKVYVWYQTQGSNLQAGQYALSQSLNAPEILEIITGGKAVSNEIQATFPEGFTISQIRDRLLEKGILAADLLTQETIDSFQIQYKFLSGISSTKSLEGFLFPDTYRFKKDIKKDEIIKKLLENFDRKLTPAMRAEIDRQGKSIYEIITMASIVQREALDESEMSVISGIFWNRIKKGMLLQSDATVNYATGKKARQPSLEDIKINSFYNTYLHVGLPPTPIGNPGIEAIKAAIYPQASDYYYFLHPLDSGAVYSKTLEEHNRNKAKYLK